MSKQKLKKIQSNIHYYVKGCLKDRSYSTQNDVKQRLNTTVKDLHGLGYPVQRLDNLKPKHIEALVSHWKEKNLSVGTIKGRMSDLRVMAKRLDIKHLIKDTNKEYNIPNRSYIPTSNKAINDIDLNKITNERIRASVMLQKEFGLRREESLKIIPSQAIKINGKGELELHLKGSWTKGGRARVIPARTEAQKQALENARSKAEGKSLIPENTNYINHRKTYDRVTRESGYYNLHGLRHAYAQRRFKELTGFDSPIAGGPKSKDLSKNQKNLDQHARKIITEELGHSRVSIVKNYIG